MLCRSPVDAWSRHFGGTTWWMTSGFRRRGRRRWRHQREMLGRDEPPVAENRRPLEDVAQLADVARPVVLNQQAACLTRDPAGRPAESPRDVGQERLAQRQDVVTPVTQRWQPDREHIEAVIEVLAELSVRNGSLQITVRGGDHPGVRAQHPGATQPLELAFLKHAEKLGLCRRAHLRHFVEKQRAARSLLELTGFALRRPGVRAAFVAKQLRLEQLFRQRGTVQRDEGTVASRASRGAGSARPLPCPCPTHRAAGRWPRSPPPASPG